MNIQELLERSKQGNMNSKQQTGTPINAQVSCTKGILTVAVSGGYVYSASVVSGASPNDFDLPNCIGTSSDPDLSNSLYQNPSAFGFDNGDGTGTITFYGTDSGFSAYIYLYNPVLVGSVSWSCWTGE